ELSESYLFASLIGNYDGCFRIDNVQAEPNVISLFDSLSLLDHTYGPLTDDRPHQFRFNGSYQTPFKLFITGSFYLRSRSPFNQLIPHLRLWKQQRVRGGARLGNCSDGHGQQSRLPECGS